MDAREVHEQCQAVIDELSSAVVVEHEVLETVLTGFLAGGNVLLEDVPGTGKTLTARSFATVLGLSFSRIQFTPDLLPADVTGSPVFDERTNELEFRPGPMFANVVLADEINRASPKTQSALLEAMEEGQVTVDGQTHQLPSPFFLIATQNPVEQEGTFALPEAQKDRFMVKTSLGYPDEDGEMTILDRRAERDARTPSVSRVSSAADIGAMRAASGDVHVDRDVQLYMVRLCRATREDPRVQTGVSPRGIQRLFEYSRSLAALRGRDYVTPDDVQDAADSVLTHRLVLSSDARVDRVSKADVVQAVLEEEPVPTVSDTGQRGRGAPPRAE